MITKANLEEAEKIYKEHMEYDFPDDEIPDYERYIKLTKEKKHNIYLYEKDNENVAYFITLEADNNILITHLAVMREHRSKGIGRVFLEDIKKYFMDKNIIIVEVEAEVRAKNEEELNIIRRRKKYYVNGGFKECENLKYILYDVDYDILSYSTQQQKIYKNIEMKEIIEKIYSKVGIKESKLKIEIV